MRTDMHADGDKIEADGLDPPAKEAVASACVSPFISFISQIASHKGRLQTKVAKSFWPSIEYVVS